MRTLLSQLPARDAASGLLNVVVDTPKGSRNKYKYEEDTGLWRLSKVLPLGMTFPFDFGFVPSTRGQDGDPLDILILLDEPTFPGCVVPSRLIGVLEADQTEGGETVRNDRLLAVVETPYNPSPLRSLDELSPQGLAEVEYFFISYNSMQGRQFRVLGREGADRAQEVLDAALGKPRYLESDESVVDKGASPSRRGLGRGGLWDVLAKIAGGDGYSKRGAVRRETGGTRIAISRRMESPEAVVAAVLQWSEAVIEQPHQLFGNLPICPFAKAARLKNAIRFEVLPFDPDDPLVSDGQIMNLLREFLRDPSHETLFVIHPEPTAFGAPELESFVARLNDRLAAEEAACGLQVFEAHPRSEFRVGNVYTRRSPFPSFQALRRSLLKSASDSLLGSHYYDQFTPQMLEMVGMPRADERVECSGKR